jgi:hypothetical protein
VRVDHFDPSDGGMLVDSCTRKVVEIIVIRSHN